MGKVINMLDIAKRSNNDVAIGIIEECLKDVPEFDSLPFSTITGTSFKTYRRTKFAHGGFRHLNTGVESSKNEGEQITVECFPFDSNIEVDELALDADDGSLGNLMATEGAGLLQGNLFELAKQIYKGTVADSKGFSGFMENYDATNMQVKASTSGSNKSSVWFVYRGLRGVRLIGGKNTALNVSKPERVYLQDGDKKYWGWTSNMSGWYGLQIAHSKSLGRLCNVGDELTDAMLTEMFWKFPSWMKPNAIYMNSESASKLHKSRSTVAKLTNGGASVAISGDVKAALPTDFLGIPIFVTDAIGNDEALVS